MFKNKGFMSFRLYQSIRNSKSMSFIEVWKEIWNNVWLIVIHKNNGKYINIFR